MITEERLPPACAFAVSVLAEHRHRPRRGSRRSCRGSATAYGNMRALSQCAECERRVT